MGVHVVWMDTLHGNKEIYYRRQSPDFADAEWDSNESGSSEIGTSDPFSGLSLAISPNPSPENFHIAWQSTIPILDEAKLEIYDASGRVVYKTTFIHGDSGSIVWDGRDQFGTDVVSGVYLVRLYANDLTTSQRVISIR